MSRRTLIAIVLVAIVALGAGIILGSGSLGLGDDAGAGFVTALNDRPGETAFTLNIQQPSGLPSPERVILRSASLALIVDDPQAKLEAIKQITDESGGWIVGSSVQSGTQTTVSIEVRVPAVVFDETIAAIKADVISVESERITGQDVTQEYTDLNSQLTNLEAAETQLLTFMESAEDTAAVLSVYYELVRIRGEIETTRGRINYFEQTAEFASISVGIYPPDTDVLPVEQDESWSPVDTVESAVSMLGDLLRIIVDVVIFLVIVGVPFLLLVGVPLGLLYRFADRRRRAGDAE